MVSVSAGTECSQHSLSMSGQSTDLRNKNVVSSRWPPSFFHTKSCTMVSRFFSLLVKVCYNSFAANSDWPPFILCISTRVKRANPASHAIYLIHVLGSRQHLVMAFSIFTYLSLNLRVLVFLLDVPIIIDHGVVKETKGFMFWRRDCKNSDCCDNNGCSYNYKLITL